jgi:hypothetical protein
VPLDAGADGVLGPGEAVGLVLDFRNVRRRRLAFTLRLLAGGNP